MKTRELIGVIVFVLAFTFGVIKDETNAPYAGKALTILAVVIGVILIYNLVRHGTLYKE